MKIIILGASGFIGNALRHALTEKKHEVIAPTHSDLDIRDAITLPHADVLYHLAANPRVYWARKNALLDFEINAMGTINVLDACVAAGIKKVVYASSIVVYKNIWEVDEEGENGYNEYGGPYGLSKLTGE